MSSIFARDGVVQLRSPAFAMLLRIDQSEDEPDLNVGVGIVG